MEWIRKANSAAPMRVHTCGEAQMLVFPRIEELGVIRHGMSTRMGGVSEGHLASMNLSYSRGDDPANVDENFRRAAAMLGGKAEDFVCSDQTHTTNIRVITEEDRGKGVVRPKDYTDVDGLVTNVPGLVLATSFADCVPILLVDPVHHVLGSSHAGWRGTVGQIAGKTIQVMQEQFGCCPKDIVAGIGPSICQDCYQVSEDVAEQFQELWTHENLSVTGISVEDILRVDKEPGKYRLNLWEANRAVLLAAGLSEKHINTTDICTCCNPELLFSHRASHGLRGNLAMLAVLNEKGNEQ